MIQTFGNATANGVNMTFHGLTGTVVDVKTWSETVVSGSGGGGGGYIREGSGHISNSPVKISSRSIRHDEIMLLTANGDEEVRKYENMDVACRKGNVLTEVWAVPQGQRNGSTWLVYNHNTKEICYTGSMQRHFRAASWPAWTGFFGGLLLAYIMHIWGISGYFGFGIIPWFILPLMLWLSGIIYAQSKKQELAAFRKSADYTTLLEAIRAAGIRQTEATPALVEATPG